jgi:hypothetical protein
MKHLIKLVASIALVGTLFTGLSVAADPEPAAAHSAITAPAYDVCAWTGVRDGWLAGQYDSDLIRSTRFWYSGHYWIDCVVLIRFDPGVGCYKWIVSTHDGYTMQLGQTPCS